MASAWDIAPVDLFATNKSAASYPTPSELAKGGSFDAGLMGQASGLLSGMSGMPPMQLTGGAGGSAHSGSSLSSVFNSSGWTVNTGSGSASGTPSSTSPLMIGGLVVAGLIAWKMFLSK